MVLHYEMSGIHLGKNRAALEVVNFFRLIYFSRFAIEKIKFSSLMTSTFNRINVATCKYFILIASYSQQSGNFHCQLELLLPGKNRAFHIGPKP